MAIVFISPQAKQKRFFKTVLMLVILVLAVAFFTFMITIFLSGKSSALPQAVANQHDVAINFTMLDSPQVKNLQPFYNLETEFTYTVVDGNGKQIQGNISAASPDDAKKMLADSGLTVVSLQEVNAGNNNPFVAH